MLHHSPNLFTNRADVVVLPWLFTNKDWISHFSALTSRVNVGSIAPPVDQQNQYWEYLLPFTRKEDARSISMSLRSHSKYSSWRLSTGRSLQLFLYFRAGYLTLFGSNSEQPLASGRDVGHSLHVYREFRKLDQLLMKSARGMLSTGRGIPPETEIS